MSIAPPERIERTGRPAAPGLARGPLVLPPAPRAAAERTGTPAEERARLADALDGARRDLAALVAAQDDPDAAAILEFQAALAEDDTLSAPAFAAIDAGAAASVAWRAAVETVAADYRGAEDEYFRARAADVADLEARVAARLAGLSTAPLALPPGAILLAADLTPSQFLEADWSEGRAVALAGGSPTAHVAILARARGVPMAVGFGPIDAAGHRVALLDADEGRLVLSPHPADHAAYERRAAAAAADRSVEAALLGQPAITADGARITVMVNAGDPAELAALDPAIADGIGLVRSEFLFHGSHGLPDEETQLAAYRRLLAWAGGRPVVVRTLDAGGDKPVAGLTREEANPFLGLRGVRLSLARPDVFRVQIRALLRAAADGDLRVMVPMVAVPDEMTAVRGLFAEEAAALAARGLAHRLPPLGMMVEVPAAALTLDLFDTDFVSIGSNDLVQYVMAAARDAPGLDGLSDAAAPAVQRLIATVVDEAYARGLPVSLCGDAGSDPAVLPKLLDAGLTSLSVAPAAVGRVKRAIADHRTAEGRR